MPRGCHIRCHPRASPDHTSTVRCTTPKPSRFNINLFAFPRHVVAVAQGPRTHCSVSSVWNTAEVPSYLPFVTACSRLKLCSSIAHVHFSVNGCTHMDKLVVARGWPGRTAANEKSCAEGALLRLSCPFPPTNTPQLQSSYTLSFLL